MNLWQAIFNNFLKFDFLIFLLAILTVFLYVRCLKLSQSLQKILLPKGNLAQGKKGVQNLFDHFDYYLKQEGEQRIIDQRQRMNHLYILFLNVTAIFPLMGLLGTVISLIPMVGTNDTALFMLALTSTFWGIVFAIIFKLANGQLQALVEGNNEAIQTYLLRNDQLLNAGRREQVASE
ncbi:MotA/TolQ/ExbB proton channel family protein [Ignavigranum ruoffiae]|uniref:MotA/TolQ/ExbB proton channel family protein n=1 Tax=Ignavigranum ruoffiae TaxID=89093 RepID=UPI00206E274E|nr:MotA/TolQ/ExbB proton channel family protein [Ignavigranum ruoffiae]UPQ86321.1 MotA/TolQ/ExbB proton channel family protein [Ignavigranum ruoffiae]